MAARNEAERLARAWIEGWSAGKPDEIPLARDFTHTSPFGVVRGRERYLDWVKLAAQNVSSLEIVKVLAGDNEAAAWFENLGPQGHGAELRLGAGRERRDRRGDVVLRCVVVAVSTTSCAGSGADEWHCRNDPSP
jgi:hypothetical protein